MCIYIYIYTHIHSIQALRRFAETASPRKNRAEQTPDPGSRRFPSAALGRVAGREKRGREGGGECPGQRRGALGHRAASGVVWWVGGRVAGGMQP